MCSSKTFLSSAHKMTLLVIFVIFMSCHYQENTSRSSFEVVTPSVFPTLQQNDQNPLMSFRNNQSSLHSSHYTQFFPYDHSSKKRMDPYQYFNQISSCVSQYDDAWRDLPGQTRRIVTQLSEKTNSSCWSNEMIEKVKGLTQQISQELNQIKRELTFLNEVAYKLNLQDLKNENYQKGELLQRLGAHYQELQEYLSYCRLKEITQNVPKITPIPNMLFDDDQADSYDRALLDLLKDSFGYQSNPQSQNRSESIWILEQQRAVIQSLYELLKTKSYILTEYQAEPCRGIEGGYHPGDHEYLSVPVDFEKNLLLDLIFHIDTGIVLMKSFDQSFEDFTQTYTSKMNELKEEGQWFYFQGGPWSQTVIYVVVREQNDKFAFRIYESGNELKVYASISNESNQKIFPFLEKREISKQELLQISFLKEIYDVAHQKEWVHSGMAFLYDKIIQPLGGALTTHPVNYETLLDPQLTAHYSYYNFPYAEVSKRSESNQLHLISTLEFFIWSKLLDVYFTLNQNRMVESESIHRFASKILTYYSEGLAGCYGVSPHRESQYLDRGVSLESSERVSRYRKILDHTDRFKRLEKKGHDLSPNQGDYSKQKTDTPDSGQQTATIERRLSSLPPNGNLNIQDWNPKPDSLAGDLEKFLVQLQPQRNRGAIEVQEEVQKILEGVPEIIKQISIEEEWLRNLNDVDLRSFIRRLNDFTQFQFWALVGSKISAPKENLGLSPIQILTQIRILTLADLAIRIYQSREAGHDFVQFPSLYSSQIKRLLTNEQKQKWISVLSIQDHSWINSFREIIKYWESQNILNDNFAFQWDRYPLYSAFIQNRRIYESDADIRNTDENHWSKVYGDPSLKEWNDLLWASRLLPGERKNLREIIQSLDYQNKKLPKEFFEIRDISFLTHFVLTGSFSSQVLRDSGLIETLFGIRSYIYRSHEQRISFPISFYYVNEPPQRDQAQTGSQKKYHENGYKIFGKNLTLPVTYFDNPSIYHLIPLYTKYTLIGDLSNSFEQKNERSSLEIWNEVIQSRKAYFSLESPKTNFPFLQNHHEYNSSELLPIPQLSRRVPLLDQPSQIQQVPVAYLELQRQLFNLSSPLLALAYFKDHPNDLREKRWQELFKVLIFQPELLVEEFHKTQNFPILLSDFCWSNFEFQMKFKDYRTASFFLRMHHLLEEFSEKINQKQEWLPDRIAREGYKRILDHLSGISDLKFQLFRDVIRTYKYVDLRRESWENIALLIEAVIYRDRHFPQEYDLNVDLEEENAIYGVYQHKRNNLDSAIAALSDDQKNDLFNHVVHTFKSSDLSSFVWTRALPEEKNFSQQIEIWIGIQRGSAHTLAIDLSVPLIFSDQHRELVLPAKISELPLFQKMIHWNTSEPYAKWLGGEKYEFLDLNGYFIRVDAMPSANHQTNTFLKIQKRWACRWYQLLLDSEVNQIAIDSNGEEEDLIQKKEDWTVMPGYRNWQFVLRDDSCTSTFEDEVYLKEEGKSSWADWDHIDLKNGGASEILVFEKGDGKLFAVIRKNRDRDEPIIQKVKYRKDRAFIYGTQLSRIKALGDSENSQIQNDNQALVEVLSRVEHPRFIWLWKDFNHEIEQVQLPRFGINFIPIQNRLVSPEMEFFALNKQQNLPKESEKWGDYTHFIMLEKEGKLRVVVPRSKFIENKQGLFLTYPFIWENRPKVETQRRNEETELYGKNSQRFLIWSIDSLDHQFTLLTMEDRFFLAFIHLWGNSSEYHPYERIRELLYSGFAKMRDSKTTGSEIFSTEAGEILNWIFSIQNNDSDPRAIALRLVAATIMIDHDLLSGRLVEWNSGDVNSPEGFSSRKKSLMSEFCSKNFDDLLELYLKYIDVRDRISQRWFSEDLERLLVKSLIVKVPHDQHLQARISEWASGEGSLVHNPWSVNSVNDCRVGFDESNLKNISLDGFSCFDISGEKSQFLGDLILKK